MELHSSPDPAEFRARTHEFLLAREPENNLIYGILAGIEAGRYDDFLLVTLEDRGRIQAAAMRTPPRNVVLSWMTDEAAQQLATKIDGPLPGVNGPGTTAASFARVWAARTGVRADRTMPQRIYALREVIDPGPIAGTMHDAHLDDVELRAGWMCEFAAEALNEITDPDEARDISTRVLTSAAGGHVLWKIAGEPVALAGFGGPTPNGIRIGPVYTPPRHRGNGYASALVAGLSARLIARGRRFCFLYTDLNNTTSNKIYSRIGYEPVCDADVYAFE